MSPPIHVGVVEVQVADQQLVPRTATKLILV
jgi:hypothetical protein